MASMHCTHAKCSPFSVLPAAFIHREARISEKQERRAKPLPEAKVNKGSVANHSPASDPLTALPFHIHSGAHCTSHQAVCATVALKPRGNVHSDRKGGVASLLASPGHAGRKLSWATQ